MKKPRLYVEKIDAASVRRMELQKLDQYVEAITGRNRNGESFEKNQWFSDELCKTLNAIANLRAGGNHET